MHEMETDKPEPSTAHVVLPVSSYSVLVSIQNWHLQVWLSPLYLGSTGSRQTLLFRSPPHLASCGTQKKKKNHFTKDLVSYVCSCCTIPSIYTCPLRNCGDCGDVLPNCASTKRSSLVTSHGASWGKQLYISCAGFFWLWASLGLLAEE